jgi:uncharacterized protein (TIGR02594 family)
MGKFVVTADALNLRDKPDVLTGKVLTILKRGDKVESTSGSANRYWLKVKHGSHSGWASFKYLQPSDAGAPLGRFPWFDIALSELGVSEIAGPGDNPRIVEYLRSTNLAAPFASHDETAWCSAFVNFCVERSGYAGTDSAAARSWLNWGRATDRPVVGCVTVFSRGNPPSGHVAFFVSKTDQKIRVLGGNQGNSVSYAEYPKERLLGYRLPF